MFEYTIGTLNDKINLLINQNINLEYRHKAGYSGIVEWNKDHIQQLQKAISILENYKEEE